MYYTNYYVMHTPLWKILKLGLKKLKKLYWFLKVMFGIYDCWNQKKYSRFFQILWLNFRKHRLILFTVFSKLQRGVYILRFMEQNKCLHNFVKMMKLTFLALCIFVLQINENLATSPEPLPCKQGQPCNVYGCKYRTHNIGISYYINF